MQDPLSGPPEDVMKALAYEMQSQIDNLAARHIATEIALSHLVSALVAAKTIDQAEWATGIAGIAADFRERSQAAPDRVKTQIAAIIDGLADYSNQTSGLTLTVVPGGRVE